MWDKRKAHIILVLFVLGALSISLCSSVVSATAQPSLVLGPLTHTFKPLEGSDVYRSEVAIDVVSISGSTDPGATVSAQQIVYNTTSATGVSVGANGAFVLTVEFTAGPDFAKGIESGAIRLTVRATSGSATKEVDVNLKPTAGLQPSVVQSASVTGGTAGYPHTLVVYNNPSLFLFGQYRNDNGQDVQTNKNDVAAQLAKFSTVSLHYTDDASNIALIKQKNPSAKVFAYINPMFCYKSSSEYQNIVSNHPEWFLYPTADDREHKTNPIVVYDGTEQVMDLSAPGWQAEIVNLSKAALAKGFDGLYVDCVCDNPSLCYGYGATTAPVGNWHNALNAYLDQVRVAGKQNFYNGQSPVVAPTNRDFLDRTDGWMDEGFISYKGWKLSAIDMPQYASALNKFTMFYAVNPDAAVRHFYFASALLSDGYFFYAPASTQWFAEYGTYLGNPVGQAYQIQGLLGVWARDYTAGKVIVNPTSATVTVNAPGYIDSSGNPTSQVSIHPNDGVVLTSSKPLTSVFVKGMDGALWWKHGTGAWQSLGGYLTSSPAAVSRSAGKITVFVRGGSGSLWSTSTTDGGASWSGWNEIGGQLLAGTGPTAYAWGDGRIGWFVTGTNNVLYHMWDDAAGRHGWENLGGYLTSSPAAVSWGNGRIDVFVHGGDNALWHMYYENGWSSWQSLGGQLAPNTGPAVSSWAAGRLDLFVVGTDNALWHMYYENGWSSWQSLGGYLTSSPAATSSTSGTVDVFARGNDGALWQREYNNGWSSWTSLGGQIAPGTGPVACS